MASASLGFDWVDSWGSVGLHVGQGSKVGVGSKDDPEDNFGTWDLVGGGRD